MAVTTSVEGREGGTAVEHNATHLFMVWREMIGEDNRMCKSKTARSTHKQPKHIYSWIWIKCLRSTYTKRDRRHFIWPMIVVFRIDCCWFLFFVYVVRARVLCAKAYVWDLGCAANTHSIHITRMCHVFSTIHWFDEETTTGKKETWFLRREHNQRESGEKTRRWI